MLGFAKSFQSDPITPKPKISHAALRSMKQAVERVNYFCASSSYFIQAAKILRVSLNWICLRNRISMERVRRFRNRKLLTNDYLCFVTRRIIWFYSFSYKNNQKCFMPIELEKNERKTIFNKNDDFYPGKNFQTLSNKKNFMETLTFCFLRFNFNRK